MSEQGDKGEGEVGATEPKGSHGGPIRLWPWIVLVLAVILIGLTALDRKGQRADDQLRDRAATELVLAQQRDAWARYDTSIASCERGNIVRAQQRAATEFDLALAAIIQEFLTSSAKFRRATDQPDLALEALAAKAKLKLATNKLHPPGNTICVDAIAAPPYPDPDKKPTDEKKEGQ